MKYKLWMRTDTGEQFCIFADGNYHALQFIVGPRLAGSIGCTFEWLEQIL